MTTREFDGRLTVLSMALAFVVFALMLHRLVWLVRDMMRPGERVTAFEATSMAILLALAAGGTSLTYVASLPWAYHEVYAWSVAFAIGSMHWMLRVLLSPDPAAVGWLLAFLAGASLTRATGGWAMCLMSLSVGVWMATGRLGPERRRRAGRVVLVAVVALLAGAAVNWLKFRHPFAFPLEDQRFTAISAQRREALAANGGSIMGPQFFPTALSAYFRPDGLRFVDYFPWVTTPAQPVRPVDGTVIDQSYRTASVTALMPWLLALTSLAAVVVLRPGVSVAHRMLRAPLVAGVLMTGGVMGYGYFATRYTAEFAPALILGGTIGTVAVTRFLGGRAWPLRAGFTVLAAAALVFGIVSNLALGYAAVATTTRGSHLDDYLLVQHRLSPDEQAALVTESSRPPQGGDTDDLWVQGDCDALFVNTGDHGSPWSLVERRGALTTVTLPRDLTYVQVKLFESRTAEVNEVWLQAYSPRLVRLQARSGDLVINGPFIDLLPPYRIRVGLRVIPDLSFADVTSVPGGHLVFLRSFDVNDDGESAPVAIGAADITVAEQLDLRQRGVRLEHTGGLTPTVCERVRPD